MPVRQKGQFWSADFMSRGQRIRQFGFATQEAAEAWEEQAREAVRRGHPLPMAPKEVAVATGISTIIILVRRVNAVRWASQKSGAMLKLANSFARWVGPELSPAEALETSQVHEYVEFLRDLERSGSTVNRHLAAISCLAKTALKLSLIDKLPDLPRQKEGEGRIRWFTEDEEADILATLDAWGERETRDLFVFLSDTGARLGEALKLEWVDVARGNRTVTFWETKAGNSRSVPLTQRAREAVERRRAERGRKGGPFSEINRSTLRSQWDRLRTRHPFIGNAVVHTFRHTCASRLVQRGVDLMRVKVWMGHKAIQTTLRYAHLAPQHLDDVLRALERPATSDS
ncbi:tyrosine-type recombinase/integrase [Ancylobacter oerskovii]|uniref:Tyrosine-type recombinase/integrase n=1 Tax=Ancylobacter oerskovii TaxID=459519 RepID=A0ABW4YUP6_9HYPH|nr:site-specific integrase [Ancylobacter oerskovii]MBS7544644.1 site-specific integrase [Ancylobacter oerskovii]